MGSDRRAQGSGRRLLSLALIGLGALLLIFVPALLVVLAFAGDRSFQLNGTLVILSAAAGMMFVVIGAALYE